VGIGSIFASWYCLDVYQTRKIDTKDRSVEQHSTDNFKLSPPNRPSLSGTARKRIRVIKKVRIARGVWKFISLDHVGNRHVWDNREDYYFLEWCDGKKRRRERAGLTPKEALEAQRRKQHELVSELIDGGKTPPPPPEEGTATPIQNGCCRSTSVFVAIARNSGGSLPKSAV
jgi:hypothetical protein